MLSEDGGNAGNSRATDGPAFEKSNSSNPEMATSQIGKSPPPEKPEAIRLRTLVICSFWAVIICLGLPMWWKTTSIYRARLPLQDMMEWADGKACRPVFPLQIEIYAPSIQTPEAEHLLRTTQHALDDLNEFSAHHLRLRLADSLSKINESTSANDGVDGTNVGPINKEVKEDIALSVRLLPREDAATPSSELLPFSSRLDVFYTPGQVPSTSSTSSPLGTYIANELQNMFTEEQATIAYILSTSNTQGQHIQSSISGSQASQSSPSAGSSREPRSSILKSTPPHLTETIARRATRSLRYAETYHLTFSLFTPGASPSSWDIESALHEYILPLLSAFSTISNFSVDTQVQLYAGFSPSVQTPIYSETQQAWTLRKEDLSAFINAAEWPLSPSIGSGPTINFVLYVPSPSQSPLVIAESSSTSWLIPQWGGVTILNPSLSVPPESSSPIISNPDHLDVGSLHPAFSTFSHQLLSLLGVPSTPPSLPLRLHSLPRIRSLSLLLSASSTMGSLARLTLSLPSIPIPASVATSVSTTLAHLRHTCTDLREGRFRSALENARVAEREAEGAFFEKSMVGQVYFPDEHKVAVYLPLLGPVGVPLVLGAVREVRRRLRSRRIGSA